MVLNLTTNQVEFLENFGFGIDAGKSNILYVSEENVKNYLIPLSDGLYKLEIYEWLQEYDGSHYEDYIKVFSKPGQSLEDFISNNC